MLSIFGNSSKHVFQCINHLYDVICKDPIAPRGTRVGPFKSVLVFPGRAIIRLQCMQEASYGNTQSILRISK